MLCTQVDIEKRVGPEKVKLWALQRQSHAPDVDVIEEAIAAATEEVYAPLRGLYADHIPFASGSQPVILRNIAVSCAIWWLASRHAEYSEIYRKLYEDALKTLKNIAAGDIPLIAADDTDLLNADTQTVLSGDTARSTTSGQTPIFTRRVLEPYMLR